MNKTNKSSLLDLNGTMIDDMQYHIVAWHNIPNELGTNITKGKIKEQCYGENQELIDHVFSVEFSI